MIKMTLKEIAKSYKEGLKEMYVDFWDMSVDLIMNETKEALVEFWFTSIRKSTRCLNWLGKIMMWSTVGVFSFVLCSMLACVFFMLGVAILCTRALFTIVGIVFYLPVIPYRWTYQRTLRPFFRFLFRKKTLECYND